MQEINQISHNDLKRAIIEKYSLPWWFSLEEVKTNTGFGWSRSADVVAFGMYESRGHDIQAFECKASRADFLGEMRKPEKAEVIAGEVDKFWIVSPKGVVKKEELPVNWGLITVKKKDTGELVARVTKQAIQMKRNREVVGREFCASLLFQALKIVKKYEKSSVLNEEINGRLEKRYDKGFEAGVRHAHGGYTEARIQKLEKAVEEFEEASGICISAYSYRNRELGKTVKAVNAMENIEGSITNALKDLLRDIDRVKKTTEQNIEIFRNRKANDG